MDFYYNKLRDIPESLGSLKNLQRLDLGENPLDQLSPGGKSALKNLEDNYCSINFESLV
ncbi:MAG: leucine-rich repeat domain-containing protein [Promethearchaeota archaeon]